MERRRITLGLILTLAAAMIFGCAFSKESLAGDPETAIQNAREHYASLNLESIGVQWLGAAAANSDSDQDGYISVTVSLLDTRDDQWHMIDLECGGGKAL